jgi:hypothetical protein
VHAASTGRTRDVIIADPMRSLSLAGMTRKTLNGFRRSWTMFMGLSEMGPQVFGLCAGVYASVPGNADGDLRTNTAMLGCVGLDDLTPRLVSRLVASQRRYDIVNEDHLRAGLGRLAEAEASNDGGFLIPRQLLPRIWSGQSCM